MNHTKIALIPLTCLALLTCGCVRRPRGVLSDKQIAPVVADLELAEAYLQTQRSVHTEEQRRAAVDYVIAKHGLTREEFDSTMSWYGRNADQYYELCSLVEKELAHKRQKATGGRTMEIESSDLWPYPRMAFLTTLSNSDALEFSIPTVDIESGQRVELKMRLNNQADGTAMLGVEYDNGTKGYLSRTIVNQRNLKLTFQTDTAHTVTRVFGNILLKDESRMPLWIDSIYLSTLPFDSMEYYTIHSQRTFREPTARRRPRAEIEAEGGAVSVISAENTASMPISGNGTPAPAQHQPKAGTNPALTPAPRQKIQLRQQHR